MKKSQEQDERAEIMVQRLALAEEKEKLTRQKLARSSVAPEKESSVRYPFFHFTVG